MAERAARKSGFLSSGRSCGRDATQTLLHDEFAERGGRCKRFFPGSAPRPRHATAPMRGGGVCQPWSAPVTTRPASRRWLVDRSTAGPERAARWRWPRGGLVHAGPSSRRQESNGVDPGVGHQSHETGCRCFASRIRNFGGIESWSSRWNISMNLKRRPSHWSVIGANAFPTIRRSLAYRR